MFKDVKDPGTLAAISLFARALVSGMCSMSSLGVNVLAPEVVITDLRREEKKEILARYHVGEAIRFWQYR